ncbi:ABC transporter ATP-binding protein [Nocardioides sp. KR10-350]|uniref:ABC transporter ATP-binding protein n=1 Tax=Nocardioides cheoyonin TaxID=3156615 RepID=UPI0032B3E25F
MLDIKALSAGYGPIHVLHDISLTVDPGEMVAVLGSNGAGKTTLFRALFGFADISAGELTFDGLDLRRTPPFRVARAGLVHVPEGRGLFPQMSVIENLMAPVYAQRSQRGRSGQPLNYHDDLDMVFELFPRLRDRRAQAAGTMSGGEQQMLAIARGLMARPKLLLLDEPSIGLAPKMVDDVFDRLHQIHDSKPDLALLIVEQSVADTLALCSRGYLLERGVIVSTGSSEELGGSATVEEAFLGTSQPLGQP